MATTTAPQARSAPSLRMLVTLLSYGVILLFALIQVLPFVFTVANSFKCLPAIQAVEQAIIPIPPYGVACTEERIVDDEVELHALGAEETARGLVFNPTLEGYEEIFDARLPRWFFNTAFISLAVMFLHLLFDSMAGYALARISFPGQRVFFFIIVSTMMIPGIVLLLPRFILLSEIGLINSYPALILPFAASLFGVFMMKQFFEDIPKEIEEAAMVDGASRFSIFFQIVLPISTPALTALAIFSFQGMWNEFLQVLLLVSNNPNLWTLPLGLSFLRGAFGEGLRWHAFLAGSVITTLPLAIIFFALQRYFVQGIGYTGLKG
jgi:multiple sugar transport system permease protein